jgi:hypothetical protein
LCVPLLHEISEDFVGSFLSFLDCWVHAGVVKLCNVIKFDLTILVHVELVVSAPDPFESVLVKVTLNLNLLVVFSYLPLGT